MNIKNRLHLKEEKLFLLDVLKPYKFAVLIFITISILVSVFDGVSIGLLVPLLGFLQGAQAVDSLPGFARGYAEIIHPYSLETQIILSVGFVILAILLKNLLLGLAFRKGLWLSNHINADVRSRIMKILLTVGIDYHHKTKVGELIEKTINFSSIMRDLFISFIEFAVYLFMLIILLFLMLLLSWQLTLVAVLMGIIILVATHFYMKQISKLGERTAKTSQALTNAVQENLSAVQLIQSYNKENDQLININEKINTQMKADIRLGWRVYWSQPITEGLNVLAIGILLIVSAIFLPQNNRLELAQLLPFLYILFRTVNTLKVLIGLRSAILSRWPYLILVYDLVREDNKPFIHDGNQAFLKLKKEIRFKSVFFNYEQKKNVLENINFSIPKGKTTAIVGKSGAGKSTVVNLLLRFYDPQQGAVLIDERPLTEFLLASYRRKIGVVSQDTFIFNDTVRFNIGFGLHEDVDEKQIIEAAKKAGAHEFIQELPDAYDTILGDRGVKLSGGQRQRISIARAILKDPKILILDEATSSLDTITEQKIHDTLKEVSRNRTVIIIAHRLSTVQNADQIIVFKKGQIEEIGTHDELQKQRGEYCILMQMQSSSSPFNNLK
jgi:ATP-binding cassette, subfamily B, bacterial MsbA